MGSELQRTLAGIAVEQEENLGKIKAILQSHQELLRGLNDKLLELDRRIEGLEHDS